MFQTRDGESKGPEMGTSCISSKKQERSGWLKERRRKWLKMKTEAGLCGLSSQALGQAL